VSLHNQIEAGEKKPGP